MENKIEHSEPIDRVFVHLHLVVTNFEHQVQVKVNTANRENSF